MYLCALGLVFSRVKGLVLIWRGGPFDIRGESRPKGLRASAISDSASPYQMRILYMYINVSLSFVCGGSLASYPADISFKISPVCYGSAGGGTSGVGRNSILFFRGAIYRVAPFLNIEMPWEMPVQL